MVVTGNQKQNILAFVIVIDLCTVNEIQSLSQRLQVAKMIKQGYTYATIEDESGASTATISRVKRSLQWGNDAYTMILDRLNIETKS
ncbi:YerC/YecD family TrpR-related protein [Staphylococcus capitis]|uniref:YerC/YecD family TrpR-related protein n=1 Tax=Staphylococcus capitis TaxID=29388 RepID=UPI003CFE24BE